MSVVTERMNYEKLNETLKSFGADDTDIYAIHSFLNSKGNCSIGIDGTEIIVERVSAGFYTMTLD